MREKSQLNSACVCVVLRTLICLIDTSLCAQLLLLPVERAYEKLAIARAMWWKNSKKNEFLSNKRVRIFCYREWRMVHDKNREKKERKKGGKKAGQNLIPTCAGNARDSIKYSLGSVYLGIYARLCVRAPLFSLIVYFSLVAYLTPFNIIAQQCRLACRIYRSFTHDDCLTVLILSHLEAIELTHVSFTKSDK